MNEKFSSRGNNNFCHLARLGGRILGRHSKFCDRKLHNDHYKRSNTNSNELDNHNGDHYLIYYQRVHNYSNHNNDHNKRVDT